MTAYHHDGSGIIRPVRMGHRLTRLRRVLVALAVYALAAYGSALAIARAIERIEP